MWSKADQEWIKRCNAIDGRNRFFAEHGDALGIDWEIMQKPPRPVATEDGRYEQQHDD